METGKSHMMKWNSKIDNRISYMRVSFLLSNVLLFNFVFMENFTIVVTEENEVRTATVVHDSPEKDTKKKK